MKDEDGACDAMLEFVMARTYTSIEWQLLTQCRGICDTNIALDTVSKVRHLHGEDQGGRRPTSTSMRDVMLGSSLQKMTRDEVPAPPFRDRHSSTWKMKISAWISA